MEGVELIGGRLEAQDQVVSEKFDNVFVEHLVLLVAAVGFD